MYAVCSREHTFGVETSEEFKSCHVDEVNDENEIGLRFLDSSKSELYNVRQHREY